MCIIYSTVEPNYFANFISKIIRTDLGLLFISRNNIAGVLNPLIVGSLIIAIGVCLGVPTGYAIDCLFYKDVLILCH